MICELIVDSALFLAWVALIGLMGINARHVYRRHVQKGGK